MNAADIAIAVVLGLSSLLSLLRGLVKEILSLLAWVVAFWVALAYGAHVAQWLDGLITQASARKALAFVVLLIGTLIAFGLLNSLVAKLLSNSGLGDTDKLLGMIFGFLRGLAIMMVLVLLASLTPAPLQDWWQSSILLPRLSTAAHWLLAWLPPEFGRHFGYDGKSGA
jgi:membrane protein required for colicin V production